MKVLKWDGNGLFINAFETERFPDDFPFDGIHHQIMFVFISIFVFSKQDSDFDDNYDANRYYQTNKRNHWFTLLRKNFF